MGTLSGQPGSPAVYGDYSYLIDIATYRDEIITVTGLVPEPSSVALTGLGGLLLLFAASRRRCHMGTTRLQPGNSRHLPSPASGDSLNVQALHFWQSSKQKNGASTF